MDHEQVLWQEDVNMQDEIEIDLKKWIRILIRNWPWILVITIVPGLIAFLLSTLGSKSYEATSLVAITKPQYVLNFDPRFQTVQNLTQNYGAYQELATNDELLVSMFSIWKDRPTSIQTLDDLRKILKVTSKSDPSLIALSATLPDPKQAAALTNLWTTLYISKAKGIYGGQNTNQVEYFQSELKNSTNVLENAEQAIIDFQSNNQLSILTNQLNSLLQAQNEYLARQRNIDYLRQDIQALKNGLANQSGDFAPNLTDQITLLYLQMRAFNPQPASAVQSNPPQNGGSVISPNTAGIQFQVDPTGKSESMSRPQQDTFLSQMELIIQSQSKDADSKLQEISPQILQIQKQVQEMKIQQDRLTRTRDVAQETYTTLARKVDETKISTGDTNGSVQLAAQAVVPEAPVSSHRLRNTAIAIVVGFFFGVSGVLVMAWWKDTLAETEKVGSTSVTKPA
ncbi:MAG: GNVR domain-containing protein [Anaerolineaceae bacterium]|nr:GNVR domain-containing protein [Anaerolineaceae bacterium]